MVMFLKSRRKAFYGLFILVTLLLTFIASENRRSEGLTHQRPYIIIPTPAQGNDHGSDGNKHADAVVTPSRGPGDAFIKSRALQTFWTELHNELDDHDPRLSVSLVSRPEDLPEGYIDPNSDRYGYDDDEEDNDNHGRRCRTILDLVRVEGDDAERLLQKHVSFVQAVDRDLARRLPYVPGSRGIVMTAGGTYTGVALTSIVLLRGTGSELPVQVFLDSRADWTPELCDVALPRLGAECVVMEDVLRLHDHDDDDLDPDTDGQRQQQQLKKIEKYQFKVLAILFSSYQNVLFLDADAWPIIAPDHVFDAEPFRSRGLVTWPDFWLPTVSQSYYRASGRSVPPVERRRASESGILLYDKALQSSSLLLAAYYNWHGPGCYYPLLSQGAPGEGDKETFLHAAVALGAPFWDVKTPCGAAGRWINGTWKSAAMVQADPLDDYALQQEKQQQRVTTDEEEHEKEGEEEHGHDRELLMKRGRENHPGNNKNNMGKKMVPTTDGPVQGEERSARPLFIHHNMWKLDLRTVANKDSPMEDRDEEGRLTRLWGDQSVMNGKSGFDVEEAMWRRIHEANCRDTFLGIEECQRLWNYYVTVFGTQGDSD